MRALSYEEDIEILEERLENYRSSLGKNSSRDTRLKLKIESMEHQLELFLKAKAFDTLYAMFKDGDRDLSKADFDEALLK